MPKHVHEDDPDVGTTGDVVHDAFRLGRELEEFCEKHEVGKFLVTNAQADLAEAIDEWLKANDPAGKESLEAHYKARVAAGILRVIKSAITQGKTAQAVLSEQEAGGSS